MKKIVVSISLVLICLNTLFSQSKVDSLLNSLENISSPSGRYELLIKLMQEQYKLNNYSEALLRCREAQVISYEIGDSSKIVRTKRSEGQLLNRLDKSKEAIVVLLQALPIAKRNGFQEEYKTILNNLGLAYTFQAQYDSALKIHFETLLLRERDQDNKEILISLNNIGLVYFKLKNYKKALEFYEKALEIRRAEKEKGEIERQLINIGLCYNQLKDFTIANKYFNEAFDYCKNNCVPQIELEGRFGQGVSNYGLDNLTEAQKYFEISYGIAKKIENQRFQAENLIYLAHIEVKRGNWKKSIDHLEECEGIAKEGHYNELLIETFKEFSNVYTLTKDFHNASLYQNKYIVLKDSIYSENLIENIAKTQTDFAERENIKTIASNKIVIEQQRNFNIAVVVICILAGLLILVLQRSNRVSKQVNAQLSEAKETIQQQNKLLEIKNKDLDREVERKTADLERVNLSLKQVNDELDNFIYKTSHDIRGPLASLKGMCNVALMDVKDPVALDYLRKLDTTAERLNSILTRLLIINQINNSKLSITRIDFQRIINDIMLLEKKKGMPGKIKITKCIEHPEALHINSDKELVRIVLENLIDNAIKFYNDSDRVESFVSVTIVPEPDGSVKARIIDNGIGISESNPGKLFQMFFRASERSEIGGIGLYIVKTATSKLGGKVGLLTTPEGYTEFYVLFPPHPPTHEEWPQKIHS